MSDGGASGMGGRCGGRQRADGLARSHAAPHAAAMAGRQRPGRARRGVAAQLATAATAHAAFQHRTALPAPARGFGPSQSALALEKLAHAATLNQVPALGFLNRVLLFCF